MNGHSMIAGVLSIISGAFGLLGLGWMLLIIFIFRSIGNDSIYGSQMPVNILNIMMIFYLILGIGFALLGILGIIGGIFALKRIHWGVALAGAIASTITFFPCGIAAIIFVVKAQPEFATLKNPLVPV